MIQLNRNYNLPEKRVGTNFVVTVGYECDPDVVERALGEVLQEATGQITGMLAEPAPTVAFEPGFAEAGMGFTVNFQVSEFANQAPVRNELRRRVLRRFRRDGLVIPYPSRTVYLRGSGKKRVEGDGGTSEESKEV